MIFTADSERIQLASADISRIAGEIERSVTEMQGRLRGLDGAWTGAAATQFHECVQNWSRVQGQVRENLAQIARLTGQAGHHYQATDDAVRASFTH